MLGYADGDSAMTEDGWFDTGDLVEEREGSYRLLGRRSDVINVGGEKVMPSVVEAVISELPVISEVVVEGRKNVVMGQVVVASVRFVAGAESPSKLKSRVVEHCKDRLPSHAVPMLVRIVDRPLHTERLKSVRKVDGQFPKKNFRTSA